MPKEKEKTEMDRLKEAYEEWREFMTKNNVKMRKKLKKGIPIANQIRSNTTILTTPAGSITITTRKTIPTSPRPRNSKPSLRIYSRRNPQ
jgi:hypothetical protein